MKGLKKLLSVALAGAIAFTGAFAFSGAADVFAAETKASVKCKTVANEFPIPPSYTYTVQNDVKSIDISVNYKVDFNAWCGEAIRVTDTDGKVTWYGFGGESVSWNASVLKDKDEVVPKAGDSKFFVFKDAKGSFTLPVGGKGSVVDIFCMSWVDVAGVHYDIVISEAGGSSDSSSAAAQDITVSKVKKTFKAAKLAKKAASFDIGASAKTALSYSVVKKDAKGKVTFDNGKVTVAQGTTAGTYKVKVKITAAASDSYKEASKTVTIKVKVK